MWSLFSALTGVHPPSAGFTLLQGIGGYSTTPRVLPVLLDTPQAAMIKMVYSTGDLRLPRVARVPYPDCRVLVDVGCSDLSTIHGIPNGYLSFARSNVKRCIFNKLNLLLCKVV